LIKFTDGTTYSQFGYSLVPIPIDFNNDGYDDIVIGYVFSRVSLFKHAFLLKGRLGLSTTPAWFTSTMASKRNGPLQLLWTARSRPRRRTLCLLDAQTTPLEFPWPMEEISTMTAVTI